MTLIDRLGHRQELLGRELDHRLALMTGEGAGQRIAHPEPRTGSPVVAVWNRLPSRGAAEPPDYYRLALLKEPVWIWSVPLYFYVGGVAGGSALLHAVLQGRRRLATLRTACRWLACIGTTVGPALLTWDLGRRLRFYNMLRVFRPTSPMSIGSWALAATGSLTALVLLQGEQAGRPAAVALAAGGLVVSGYTGVLLANTANPLWGGSRRTLPLLFSASAIASTAAALEFLSLNRQEEAVVRRFGIIGKVAEALGMTAMEHEAGGVAAVFRSGRTGLLWHGARGCLAAGLLAALCPGRSGRSRRIGAALTTAGALCLRFALLEAGKRASREPQALFIAQRR